MLFYGVVVHLGLKAATPLDLQGLRRCRLLTGGRAD